MQMTVTGAEIIVLILAAMILMLSAWGLVVPRRLLAMVRGVMEHPRGMYAAVLARLILGLALLIAAPGSRYPLLLHYLGWFALAAAVALPLIGRDRIVRFLGWFDRVSALAIRLWLLFGIAFSAFLVHALL
jgi:hypothetical protein